MRDEYATVGAAMRRAIARASHAKLSNGERRTLDAVFALVSSYSRLQDRVYVVQVARAAGLSERHTRNCLERLAQREIIVWRTGRGRSVKSTLGLPTETGTHAVPLSHSDVAPIGADPDEGKPEQQADENRNDRAPKTGSPGVPLPEKYRGEGTEESAPHVDAYASTCGEAAGLDDPIRGKS